MWIVAASKSKCEHLARWNLEKQGYEVYLPVSVSPENPKAELMFPGYIFVNLEPMEGQWRPINSTTGISSRGVLRTGEAPSRVPAKAINDMLSREEAGVIRIKRKEAVAALEPGESIRIHEGQFTGFNAVFEREEAADRVRVLLELFGRVIAVEMDGASVAKVA